MPNPPRAVVILLRLPITRAICAPALIDAGAAYPVLTPRAGVYFPAPAIRADRESRVSSATRPSLPPRSDGDHYAPAIRVTRARPYAELCCLGFRRGAAETPARGPIQNRRLPNTDRQTDHVPGAPP